VSAVLDALRVRGGTASSRTLRAAAGRAALERAVAGGEVLRVGWGTYALPDVPAPLVAAAALHGVVSHDSAARLWLVEPLHRPSTAHVTVPPTSSRRERPGVRLHWSPIRGDEVMDRVTSPLRTVLDCSRSLPFGEALGVADGFLRRGLVEAADLRGAAEAARGPFRRRLRAVAEAADGRSANPFESALRAVVLEAGAGDFEPQVEVRAGAHGRVRPDLVDVGRRIALEADSFSWHGSRAALAADCRRYNALVASGFLVLRFSWEQVVGEPDRVAADVRDVVDLVDGHPAAQDRRTNPLRAE